MKLLIVLVLVLAIYFGSLPLFVAVSAFVLIRLSMHFWIRRASSHVLVSRHADRRLFFGETAAVTVHVATQSRLPIPWLLVRDHVPVGLGAPGVISHAMTLRGGQASSCTYELAGRQRGYHALGPLRLTAGDIFGLAHRELEVPVSQGVLVYPRLLTARELELPNLAMFGDMRSRRRLLGDPARIHGVRDYVPGDPLHDIHWRATASAGALQVKQYQPSTTVQTMIALDLQQPAYADTRSHAAAEFAISVAATVAARMLDQRQEVGLVTNGRLTPPLVDNRVSAPAVAVHDVSAIDSGGFGYLAPSPIAPTSPAPIPPAAPAPIAPARGQAQLLRLLELLACVELASQEQPLPQFLVRHALNLPWGSTVVAITAALSDELFLALHRLREAGLLVMLVCVRAHPDRVALEARARSLGVQLHFLPHDKRQEAISL